MTDLTGTSSPPSEGRSYTTPEGYTLRVFSSMYIDWGLAISFQGIEVFYSPHCLGSETYGRKPDPRYEDWDEAEAAEASGDDAFIEWSDEDWRECLRDEADTFLEAYVGEDAFEVVAVAVTLLDREDPTILVMSMDETGREIVREGHKAWREVHDRGFPVHEVTTTRVPPLALVDLSTSGQAEDFWESVLKDQRAIMPDEDLYGLNHGDDWHFVKVPRVFLRKGRASQVSEKKPLHVLGAFSDRAMTLSLRLPSGHLVTALPYHYSDEE